MTKADIIKQDFKAAIKAAKSGNKLTASNLFTECLNNGASAEVIANAMAMCGLISESEASKSWA